MLYFNLPVNFTPLGMESRAGIKCQAWLVAPWIVLVLGCSNLNGNKGDLEEILGRISWPLTPPLPEHGCVLELTQGVRAWHWCLPQPLHSSGPQWQDVAGAVAVAVWWH